MRQLLTKLAVIIISFAFITSCATNTQNENTAVGAGTGAVAGGLVGTLAKGAGRGWIIGAGAVVGAIIGGLIGQSMDSSDKAHVNHVMDNNQPYKSTDWKNEKSGTHYKVTPTSKQMSWNGSNNCRTYNMVSTTSSQKSQEVSGTACRQTDGTWQGIKAS